VQIIEQANEQQQEKDAAADDERALRGTTRLFLPGIFFLIVGIAGFFGLIFLPVLIRVLFRSGNMVQPRRGVEMCMLETR
jgi:hypothetical protein